MKKIIFLLVLMFSAFVLMGCNNLQNNNDENKTPLTHTEILNTLSNEIKGLFD